MGEAPRRIQRSRAKGWRMPPNAIYVGRPTPWGNRVRVIGPETLLDGMRLGLRMGAEIARDAPGWNAAQIAAEIEAEAEALSAPPAPPEPPHAAR